MTCVSPLLNELQYRPFLILVAIGIVVRVVLARMYYPAVMLSFDAPRYARVDMPLFGDFWMPAGYPILLQVLHGLSHHLWFTIAVQHAMGVIVGVLLFIACRQLGLPRAVALVPSAVALLSGDHLYLEHQIMADSTLIFWLTVGLTAAVFVVRGDSEWIWIIIASVALSFAALTRSVAISSLPILFFCSGSFVRGSAVHRSKIVLIGVVAACAVFSLYIGSWYGSHGQYLGLVDMRGWNLYSRVAPFADCTRFTPPPGTEVLCETRPAEQRPGPFGYVWDLTSIARRKFLLGPDTGVRLEAFARDAILHQPLDYLRAVAVDLARYVEPWSTSQWAYAGQSPGILSFGWRDTNVEQVVVQALAKQYRGTKVRVHGKDILAMYQNIMRLTGFPVLALIAGTLVGMVATQSPLRLGSVLFGLTAFALYIVPALTVSYDFRYGVPAVTFLTVSGLCGFASIWPVFRR